MTFFHHTKESNFESSLFFFTLSRSSKICAANQLLKLDCHVGLERPPHNDGGM